MAKVVRKPLGDLTNTNRPRAHDWVKEEGFLHNHDECIKAKRQSQNMIMDHYLQSLNDIASDSLIKAHPQSQSLNDITSDSIFLSFSDSDSDSDSDSHNMSDFEIHSTSPRKRPESPSWNVVDTAWDSHFEMINVVDTAWDSHFEMLCENSLAALKLAALNLK